MLVNRQLEHVEHADRVGGTFAFLKPPHHSEVKHDLDHEHPEAHAGRNDRVNRGADFVAGGERENADGDGGDSGDGGEPVAFVHAAAEGQRGKDRENRPGEGGTPLLPQRESVPGLHVVRRFDDGSVDGDLARPDQLLGLQSHGFLFLCVAGCAGVGRPFLPLFG